MATAKKTTPAVKSTQKAAAPVKTVKHLTAPVKVAAKKEVIVSAAKPGLKRTLSAPIKPATVNKSSDLATLKPPVDQLPPRYYEVKPGTDKKFYWNARDRHNDEITSNGQGHTTQSAAIAAIRQEREAVGATTDLVVLVLGDRPEKIVEPSAFVRASVVAGKDFSAAVAAAKPAAKTALSKTAAPAAKKTAPAAKKAAPAPVASWSPPVPTPVALAKKAAAKNNGVLPTEKARPAPGARTASVSVGGVPLTPSTRVPKPTVASTPEKTEAVQAVQGSLGALIQRRIHPGAKR